MGMLRDEVRLFEKLSGESANDVTIERLGSFLDGYFVGKEGSVVHAHWTYDIDDLSPMDSMMICSNCGEYEHIYANGNYCGNCGAQMDEEVE